MATINNPNMFPVTITAIELPSDTAFADGYTSADLASEQPGCTSSTPSDVTWAYSTSTSGTSHTLTQPLIVAADATLTVTFTDDVAMSTSAPTDCAGTYFLMPSLAGVVATAGGSSPTSSPATDSWTS